MKIEQKGNVLVLGEGADATISTSKFVAYTTGATDAPKLVVENVDGNTAIRVEIEQVGDVRIGNTTGYTSFEDVVLELSKLPSFTKASATGGNSGGGVSPEDMLWKYEGILENKYYWSEPDEHGYPYYPTFYVDLKDRTETCVLSEISESPNMQITLPPAKVGFVTTCALLLKINDYAPNGTSIEFPRNVVWSGGVAPDFSLKNGYYRIVFNIYSDNKVLADVFIY